MASSPSRQTLYRRFTWAVILAAAVSGVPALLAQFARVPATSKGPRALGLLQLAPNGKAHLIPICIMVDGKFYDATIYKATPVPMALEPETVYEAERTGVPAGLFTVTGAAQGNGAWLGAGTWLEAGAEPPSTGRKAEARPREEQEDKPPVLRRPRSEKPSASNPAGAQPSTGPEAKPTPSAAKPPGQSSTTATSSAAKSASSESAPPEDTGRPRLRRGVPTPPATAVNEVASTAALAKHPSSPHPRIAKGELQLIPAISDADGPDPRPYTYDMKPGEQQEFREKMLELAAAEVLKGSPESQVEPIGQPTAAGRKTRSAAKKLPPQFENVKLSVFDLSTNNEPILVLSATGHRPASRGKPQSASADHYITLVARVDLYGELRPIFSGITDEQHLDVSPRMQLIDAVDVDGDGRGELLFRQTSDTGSVYAVYRVTPDRLVPLFEGSPAGQQ